MKTDWDVVNSWLCCSCHYEHGFFSGPSFRWEVSSISSHSRELKTSFFWALRPTRLWMCWFSRTSHNHNQMFQHPHFQSGFLICSMKWLTTYWFSIYPCILLIYTCMYVCIHVFVTHFLLFLTSSKAFPLKSEHEIKTDLIYFPAHTSDSIVRV